MTDANFDVDSDIRVARTLPARVYSDPELFRAQQDLKLDRALLVTVPVPAAFAVPAGELKQTLDAALQQAEQQSISGRELTPFLLSRMATSSKGATLKANIALLENNARIAAEIANALS